MEIDLEQFFESYGNWIAFGGMFLAMFAMHALGMGHSGHGHGHDSDAPAGPRPPQDKREN